MDTVKESERSNPSDVEYCHSALLLYLESYLPFLGEQDSPKKKADRKYRAFQDATSLATTPHGLRIGAPGWPDAKLYWVFRYPDNERKIFYINGNGMDENKFEKWQDFIAEKFTTAGFNFRKEPIHKQE